MERRKAMDNPTMQQIEKFWNAAAWTSKLAIVACSVLPLFFFFAILLPSGSSSEYRALCDDLADKTSVVELADELEANGISYRIVRGGHSIEVKESEFGRALSIILSNKHGRSNSRDSMSSMFSPSLLSSSRNSKGREIRLRESELARTISMYGSIKRTRVHIAPTEEGLFSGKRKEARASVFLQLAPGKSLSRCKLLAIRDLIANSVQGLRKSNIAIADSTGTDYEQILAQEKAQEKAEEGRQNLELQEGIEEFLAQKIKEHLSVMFGKDNVTVAVSARVDSSCFNSEEGLSIGDSRQKAMKLSVAWTASPEEGIGTSPKKGNTILDSVRSLCVAVFIDSHLFANERLPRQLEEAVRESIHTVARIEERRGDRVSIRAVPFRRASPTPSVTAKRVTSTVAKLPLSAGARVRSVFESDSSVIALPIILLSTLFLCFLVMRRKAMTRRMRDDATALSGFFNVKAKTINEDDFDDWEGEGQGSNVELVRETAKDDPEVIARLIKMIRLDSNDDVEY